MYYKNQTFFIFVSFIFFIYATFHYLRYSDVKIRSKVETVTIVRTSCSAAPKLASAIVVSKNNKDFSVELPYDSCYKYSSGDRINLLYDEKYSRFYLSNYFGVYKFRAIFTAIIMLIVIIPWKSIVSSISKWS